MEIIIVGAGIGGLTAALCLANDRHHVTVIERSGQLSEVGAGLQCGANAVRVLDYLGLGESLRAKSVLPKAIQFRDFKSGRAYYQVELGSSYREKYGAPYCHIHRADLLQILTNAVQANELIDVRLGESVTSVFEDQEQATLHTQSGCDLSADLIIGCDGINSCVRTFVDPSTTPRFTGNSAWRALVPVDRLPADFMSTTVCNFVGPKKHMVMYYVRNRQLLNLVGVVEKPTVKDSSWSATAPWEDLQSDFQGWHPMVESAITALEYDTCYQWALYEQPAMQQWSTERVTLLGDAAHATLPFMASGAALAIEDARILQRALRLNKPLSDRLKIYQKSRLPRTSRVQTLSRKFGTLYHIPVRQLQAAAFRGLSLVPGKKENFLPEYDANTVSLSV